MNKKNIDYESIINDCINALRKHSEKKLNQFVVENGLSIPEELSDEIDKMLTAIKVLSKKYNNASFIEHFFDESEKIFCDCIKDYIDYKIRTNKELSIIHHLNNEDFNQLFEYVFENYILENNELESYSVFNETQIKVAIKVINTSIHLIIDELLSKKFFLKTSLDIFELCETKSTKIWEMINENKTELRYISIIRKLNS